MQRKPVAINCGCAPSGWHEKGACLSAKVVMKLLPLMLFVFGCEAQRYEVDAAILSSFYADPSFFDAVCGFPLDTSSPHPRLEILEAAGEAKPWLGIFGAERIPGTARIRLTKVIKKGESGEFTCEADISFLWSETKTSVPMARGTRMSSSFTAEDFKVTGH